MRRTSSAAKTPSDSATKSAVVIGRGSSTCVDINRRFGTSRPNFEILELGHIEVDSADFWTDRLLSSSSRSTAEVLVSKHSNTRTLKSGLRFDLHTGAARRA